MPAGSDAAPLPAAVLTREAEEDWGNKRWSHARRKPDDARMFTGKFRRLTSYYARQSA
jgi:hypothetical protein